MHVIFDWIYFPLIHALIYFFLFQPTEEAGIGSTVTNRKTALITKIEKETLRFQKKKKKNTQYISYFATGGGRTNLYGPFRLKMNCLGYVEISAQVESAPLKSLTAFSKAGTKLSKKKAKKPLPLLTVTGFFYGVLSAA